MRQYTPFHPRIYQILIISTFFIMFYLLFNQARSLYETIQLDKNIEAFEKENRELKKEIEEKQFTALYAFLTRFDEKMGKKDLNKRNPQEDVIVVHPEEGEIKSKESTNTKNDHKSPILTEEDLKSLFETSEDDLLDIQKQPPYLQWVHYVFSGDQ